MYIYTLLWSVVRHVTPRAIAGVIALSIVAAPALATAAPSGEPAAAGVSAPLAGLVNAALTAGMGQNQEPSLRDAIAPGNPFVRKLVYTAGSPGDFQDAPGQRQPYDLSLLDAVELALRNNLNVQVSRFGPQQAFNGILSSRSQFDPQLSFSIPQTFSRGSSPSIDELAGAAIVSSQNLGAGFSWSENLEWGTSYSISYNTSRSSTNSEFATVNPSLRAGLNGSITQNLLRGFGDVNRNGIRIQMNNYDSSLEGFRAQVQGLVLSTITTYWNLRAASAGLTISQQALDLAEQQYDRNTIQVEIGTLAPIETVQAQTAMEQARLGLIGAQNQLESAQDALKELINFDTIVDNPFAYDLIPTDEPEETAEPIDIDEAVRVALENDPSLAQQRLGLRNAELNLDSARDGLKPTLTARASFGLSGVGGTRRIGPPGSDEFVESGLGQALGQILSGDFNSWSVGATLSMPLHNYGAKASAANAELNQRSAMLQYRQREQQLTYDVRNQVRQVENLARQVSTATLRRELAQRQLEAEQRKFEVGTSTNFEVLTFQNDYSTAQIDELNRILQLQQAIAQLEQLKGTILETYGVDIGDAGVGSNGQSQMSPLPGPIGEGR